MTEAPKLLAWARSLQAIAQSGLAYEPSAYDGERYVQVRRVAAEMLAQPNGLDASDVELRLATEWGHATPKLDVRGAVFRDGGILLVQEAGDRGWSLPGGWADIWKAVFLCELVDATQQTPDAEILDTRFFSRDELPGLRYSRASAWQLDRCFAHLDDPGLPTEFD